MKKLSESLRIVCGGRVRGGGGGGGQTVKDGAWYIINPQKYWLLLNEMKPNLLSYIRKTMDA